MNLVTGKSLFNVIVRADPSQPMPIDRMLEGTEAEIKPLVCQGQQFDLEALYTLPCVMTAEFREKDNFEHAIVGYMDAPSLNPQIRNPIMRVPSSALLDCGLLGRWGNSRTHWKVVAGNPFKLLAPYAVNNIAHEQLEVDDRLVAVMMPFAEEAALDPVYQAVKNACTRMGYECKRVDELSGPRDITNDIIQLICRAKIVIADISGKNPNVLFEYGFAFGKDKDVVTMTTDDLSSLPFDIRQWRAIRYHKTEAGLKELSSKLEQSLSSLQQHI